MAILIFLNVQLNKVISWLTSEFHSRRIFISQICLQTQQSCIRLISGTNTWCILFCTSSHPLHCFSSCSWTSGLWFRTTVLHTIVLYSEHVAAKLWQFPTDTWATSMICSHLQMLIIWGLFMPIKVGNLNVYKSRTFRNFFFLISFSFFNFPHYQWSKLLRLWSSAIQSSFLWMANWIVHHIYY